MDAFGGKNRLIIHILQQEVFLGFSGIFLRSNICSPLLCWLIMNHLSYRMTPTVFFYDLQYCNVIFSRCNFGYLQLVIKKGWGRKSLNVSCKYTQRGALTVEG